MSQDLLRPVADSYGTLRGFTGGQWTDTEGATELLDIENPATLVKIGEVPLSGRQAVDDAVRAAHGAFPAWRETPPLTRAQFLFRLKQLMEERFEDLSRIIVQENGKTIGDARGEVRRAIESVEVATGIPSLLMGYGLEDIASGIDGEAIRQPLGVCGVIGPFNFPLMVPLWFVPFALACGNTVVIKPSEQVPLSMTRFVELTEEAGVPPGVVNLVHGAREPAEALVEHPLVRTVSFVGSTPVAKAVYAKAAAAGKRVQCGGGAKNFLVVMPDAELDSTIDGLMSSIFGAAGQRCLAGSVVIPVGSAHSAVRERLADGAQKLRLGDGLSSAVQMGPLISAQSAQRVLEAVERAVDDGAELVVDRRHAAKEEELRGHFVGPVVFDNVTPDMGLTGTEVFGPVAAIMRADGLDEAIEQINASQFGNAASIFTASGRSAREFRHRVEAGNIGINVGVAAPMAFFPFAGMKDSFFGSLHPQGRESIDFFTDRKYVVSRW